jgi:hypothetical protein
MTRGPPTSRLVRARSFARICFDAFACSVMLEVFLIATDTFAEDAIKDTVPKEERLQRAKTLTTTRVRSLLCL